MMHKYSPLLFMFTRSEGNLNDIIHDDIKYTHEMDVGYRSNICATEPRILCLLNRQINEINNSIYINSMAS